MSLQAPDLATARFRALIERADGEIDLAEAALLIAKSAYPDLDVGTYISRIEQLAQDISARLPNDANATDRILALNRYLFDEQGFGPNVEDYYDQRNSFLNDVLERRVGIPISLSVLYIEVGRRLGLPLQGVSFPGHFLVKCRLEDGVVILDPFSGGASLSLQDLQARLRATRGGEVSRAIVASMLVSADKKQILARMLRNLKAIYVEQGDHVRALSVMDWIVSVAPGEASEVRDRGLLYMKLEAFRAALADLEQYLVLAPEAEDAQQVRGHVLELRQRVSRLN